MKKYLKAKKKYLTISVLCSLIAALVAVALQFVKGKVLDLAISGNFSETFFTGVLLLLAILTEIGLMFCFDYYRGKYGVNVEKRLKQDYFASLLKQSPLELRSQKQGNYIAQYTNQIELVVRNYFITIPLLIEIVFKIIIVSIALFILDYRIALLTIFLLTMPLYVPKMIEKRLQNSQKDKVKAYEKQLSKVVEWLSGFELIKSFSISEKIIERHEMLNADTKDKSFTLIKLGYISRLITTLLSYISHFVILFVSALLVVRGEFTPGQFFIAISMIDQLSYPIISLSMYIHEIIASKTVANDISEKLNFEVLEKKNIELTQESITLQYKDVHFSYGENQIINGFNLRAKSNEKYLIIGDSGSGKSTLMNLLRGHYEPQQGVVSINSVNTSLIGNLNEHVTFMSQEAFLFNESLRNNLLMYHEIDDAKIIKVLKELRLDKFANLEALDQMVLENASNFSGGEKKRIALARTLLRDTPIIILDEPLSNVDKETVQSIEEVIMTLNNKLLFVISHHFDQNKMKHFDHVISLNDQNNII